MLILNKPFCDEEFVKVKTIEDIKKTHSNHTLVFEYCESSIDVYNFCKLNNIEYGVIISNIKELIFISNLKAKYAFTDILENAISFQKIAEDYLLDTKIVYLIDDLDEIEKIVEFRIDAIKLKEHK